MIGTTLSRIWDLLLLALVGDMILYLSFISIFSNIDWIDLSFSFSILDLQGYTVDGYY